MGNPRTYQEHFEVAFSLLLGELMSARCEGAGSKAVLMAALRVNALSREVETICEAAERRDWSLFARLDERDRVNAIRKIRSTDGESTGLQCPTCKGIHRTRPDLPDPEQCAFCGAPLAPSGGHHGQSETEGRIGGEGGGEG